MSSVTYTIFKRILILSVFLATLSISASAANIHSSNLAIDGTSAPPLGARFKDIEDDSSGRKRRSQEVPRVHKRVGRPLKQFNPRETKMAKKRSYYGGGGYDNGGYQYGQPSP